MTKRINRWFVPVAAVAAAVVGGGAIASAQTPAQTPAPITKSAAITPEPVGGPDTDTIQSGDQTTPDTVGAQKIAATAEAPGTEQPAASELPGAPEQPGSETAADSDGPGGHADEPGNPSIDHQFEGVQ